MNFLELVKQRCATRGFINKQIEKDDLDRILSAGRVAPSASNMYENYSEDRPLN